MKSGKRQDDLTGGQDDLGRLQHDYFTVFTESDRFCLRVQRFTSTIAQPSELKLIEDCFKVKIIP